MRLIAVFPTPVLSGSGSGSFSQPCPSDKAPPTDMQNYEEFFKIKRKVFRFGYIFYLKNATSNYYSFNFQSSKIFIIFKS